jgi:CTP-dependent riboflavin kinase
MNLEQAMNLVAKAQVLRTLSSGELAEELHRRAHKGTDIKITRKGVRVSHSHYFDELRDAASIDRAIQNCRL